MSREDDYIRAANTVAASYNKVAGDDVIEACATLATLSPSTAERVVSAVQTLQGRKLLAEAVTLSDLSAQRVRDLCTEMANA